MQIHSQDPGEAAECFHLEDTSSTEVLKLLTGSHGASAVAEGEQHGGCWLSWEARVLWGQNETLSGPCALCNASTQIIQDSEIGSGGSSVVDWIFWMCKSMKGA